MKKLLYLFLALTIISCGGDDDGGDNPFGCNGPEGIMAASAARQIAINYSGEDYDYLVSQHGQPIDEGYFTDGVEDEFGDVYCYYVFLFVSSDNPDERICHSVDYCVTYTITEGCAVSSIEDCDGCVFYGDYRLD